MAQDFKIIRNSCFVCEAKDILDWGSADNTWLFPSHENALDVLRVVGKNLKEKRSNEQGKIHQLPYQSFVT